MIEKLAKNVAKMQRTQWKRKNQTKKINKDVGGNTGQNMEQPTTMTRSTKNQPQKQN